MSQKKLQTKTKFRSIYEEDGGNENQHKDDDSQINKHGDNFTRVYNTVYQSLKSKHYSYENDKDSDSVDNEDVFKRDDDEHCKVSKINGDKLSNFRRSIINWNNKKRTIYDESPKKNGTSY